MPKLIYLAGGMKDGWQDCVPSGYQVLDPRRNDDPDPAIYTERDLADVRSCDVVLAYMSSANPSGFGMSLEIGFAHALGKPVLFVDCIGDDWRSRYFGMVREIAKRNGGVFPSIGAALLWLNRQ